jgi:hypothetical protein
MLGVSVAVEVGVVVGVGVIDAVSVGTTTVGINSVGVSVGLTAGVSLGGMRVAVSDGGGDGSCVGSAWVGTA